MFKNEPLPVPFETLEFCTMDDGKDFCLLKIQDYYNLLQANYLFLYFSSKHGVLESLAIGSQI